jgi:hypothetical protein
MKQASEILPPLLRNDMKYQALSSEPLFFLILAGIVA